MYGLCVCIRYSVYFILTVFCFVCMFLRVWMIHTYSVSTQQLSQWFVHWRDQMWCACVCMYSMLLSQLIFPSYSVLNVSHNMYMYLYSSTCILLCHLHFPLIKLCVGLYIEKRFEWPTVGIYARSWFLCMWEIGNTILCIYLHCTCTCMYGCSEATDVSWL